jgi:hypothetical protein
LTRGKDTVGGTLVNESKFQKRKHSILNKFNNMPTPEKKDLFHFGILSEHPKSQSYFK